MLAVSYRSVLGGIGVAMLGVVMLGACAKSSGRLAVNAVEGVDRQDESAKPDKYWLAQVEKDLKTKYVSDLQQCWRAEIAGVDEEVILRLALDIGGTGRVKFGRIERGKVPPYDQCVRNVSAHWTFAPPTDSDGREIIATVRAMIKITP